MEEPHSRRAGQLLALAGLCRSALVRETLGRLASLLCESLAAAGLTWDVREAEHTIVQLDDGRDARCCVTVFNRVGKQQAPLTQALDPLYMVEVRLRTRLSDDWKVDARVVAAASAWRGMPTQFWSRAVLLGDDWHLNTDHQVLELEGLYDQWEHRCLLEVAEFVAAAVEPAGL